MEGLARQPAQGLSGLTLTPINIRQYLRTVLGSGEPPKQEEFSPSDLEAVRHAVQQTIQRTGQNQGVIGYGDYTRNGDIALGLQDPGLLQMLYRSFTDPAFRMETTLGMARYKLNANGEIEVNDHYDFNAPRNQVDQAKQSIGLSLLNAYKQNGAFGLANAIGNFWGKPAEEGKPYSINLGPYQK